MKDDDGFQKWFYSEHPEGWRAEDCTLSEASIAESSWKAAIASMSPRASDAPCS